MPSGIFYFSFFEVLLTLLMEENIMAKNNPKILVVSSSNLMIFSNEFDVKIDSDDFSSVNQENFKDENFPLFRRYCEDYFGALKEKHLCYNECKIKTRKMFDVDKSILIQPLSLSPEEIKYIYNDMGLSSAFDKTFMEFGFTRDVRILLKCRNTPNQFMAFELMKKYSLASSLFDAAFLDEYIDDTRKLLRILKAKGYTSYPYEKLRFEGICSFHPEFYKIICKNIEAVYDFGDKEINSKNLVKLTPMGKEMLNASKSFITKLTPRKYRSGEAAGLM